MSDMHKKSHIFLSQLQPICILFMESNLTKASAGIFQNFAYLSLEAWPAIVSTVNRTMAMDGINAILNLQDEIEYHHAHLYMILNLDSTHY